MGERKFLRAFICLTLMLALLLGTVGAQAAERSVTILRLTNDFVNIRSGTGEGSRVIGTLRQGTLMFYLNRSGSMAYVCTTSGTQGYVYAGYLEKVGEVRIGNVYYVQSSSLTVYQFAQHQRRPLGNAPQGLSPVADRRQRPLGQDPLPERRAGLCAPERSQTRVHLKNAMKNSASAWGAQDVDKVNRLAER